MRHKLDWTPSKFEFQRGVFRASRSGEYVNPCSRFLVDEVAAKFQAAIPEHVSGDLLDLGCGAVPLYGAYEGFVDKVTCIDWNESQHELKHLDVSHDLNTPLPFDSDSFDTVICSDVIEHLHSPSLVFSEVARVLRSGGKLVLSVPFLYWIHEAPHDYYRYTEFALVNLCKASNLRVFSITPVGGVWATVLDLTGRGVSSRPLLSRIGLPILHFWANRFSRSGDAARRYPLFYFLVATKH